MKDAVEEEGDGEEKGGEKVRRRDGHEASGENKRAEESGDDPWGDSSPTSIMEHVSECGGGLLDGRQEKTLEPQKQFVKRYARLHPKPRCGDSKSCV